MSTKRFKTGKEGYNRIYGRVGEYLEEYSRE